MNFLKWTRALNVSEHVCLRVHPSELISRGAYRVRSGSGRGEDSSWLRYTPIWRQHCHWQKTWAVSRSSPGPGRTCSFRLCSSACSLLAPACRSRSSPRETSHRHGPERTAPSCRLPPQNTNSTKKKISLKTRKCFFFWFHNCLAEHTEIFILKCLFFYDDVLCNPKSFFFLEVRSLALTH